MAAGVSVSAEGRCLEHSFPELRAWGSVGMVSSEAVIGEQFAPEGLQSANSQSGAVSVVRYARQAQYGGGCPQVGQRH